jgi:hypothetical protein
MVSFLSSAVKFRYVDRYWDARFYWRRDIVTGEQRPQVKYRILLVDDDAKVLHKLSIARGDQLQRTVAAMLKPLMTVKH